MPNQASPKIRMSRQVIAEDLLHAEQSGNEQGRVAPGLVGDLSKTACERGSDVDGTASFVDTCDIAHPSGHAERQPIDALTVVQALPNGRQQTLRKFLTPVHGDLPGSVLQGRIGKPSENAVAVVTEFLARQVEGRHDFLVYQRVNESCEGWGAHDISDVIMAGQVAKISEGRMGSVQDTKLHSLERLHPINQLNPYPLEGWPSVWKPILDNPLAKRLGHHRPSVVHVGEIADDLAVGVRGRRYDSIDH